MRIEEVLKQNESVLSLPEVCVRIQTLADDPDAELEEFAAAVAQDPAFTGQLLRRVNSAYYGFPAKISTVSRAIQLIGIRELRALSLGISAVEVFKGLPMHGYDMLAFWRHTVFTALLARELARKAHVLHVERVFVAGLLHDIGHLVIFSQLGDLAAPLAGPTLRHDVDLVEREREILGWDHAALGGALLRQWQLPTELGIAVQYHHAPLGVGRAQRETALVYLANEITHVIERQALEDAAEIYDPYSRFLEVDQAVAASVFVALTAIQDEIWQQANVTESLVPDAVRAAAGQFEDLLQALYEA